MFERIKEAISSFTLKKKIDKKDVENLIKEIQRALILGDVNIHIVKEITEEIKKKIFEEKIESISLRDYSIKAIYEVLTNYLGKESKDISLQPKTILLIGLYGAGKTTTAGKLGYYFKKRNMDVCLICADIYRPAAYEQLQTLSKKIGAKFYGEKGEKNAVKIVSNALKKCDAEIKIIDSAGRDNINEDLLKEIKEIYDVAHPDEVWLVIPGDIGSVAKNLVEGFKNAIPITGIIVTKMDTSAKGGGALVGAYLTRAPVVFIGSGEKIEDLEHYDPKRFVSRLLGMGDLEGLLQKVKELEEEAKTVKEYLESGEYNMYVFYEQIKSMQKMGSFQKILEMIPGASMLGVKKEEIEEQENKIKKWKYMIDSMTKEERLNPSIINASRIQRIAKGSGTKEEEVRELLKAYKMSEKMFKSMRSGKIFRDPKLRKFMKGIPKEVLEGMNM